MRRGIALFLFFTCAHASASFYDFDPTLDHQKGLPPVAAILAGKFEQHSPGYYEWIIADQKKRLAARGVPGAPFQPTNALIFAPALARSGNLEDALAALDPNRNFATSSPIEASMRASILIALGEHQAGADEMRKYLQSGTWSPFAREEFELKLAEYLASVQADPALPERLPTFVRAMLLDEKLPTASSNTEPEMHWLQRVHSRDSQQIQNAMKAITAMIRFGDVGSAHLYAALGDLLRVQGDPALAYRAYRRALDHAHPWPQAIERELQSIRNLLQGDPRISHDAIDAESRAAQTWVSAYQAFEVDLLRAGRSPHNISEFAKFYALHGNLREPAATPWTHIFRFVTKLWPALTILSLMLLVSMAMLVRSLRRRFGRTGATAAG